MTMAQHKWHKEIKAWADGAEIEESLLCEVNHGEFDWSEWRVTTDPTWETIEYMYRIKPHAKCITKDCTNHVNEGKFVGDLCGPCWEYITNGKGIHSQAYRNAQPKEPQYLYAWFEPNYGKSYITANTSVHSIPSGYKYLGKIKLENDNE